MTERSTETELQKLRKSASTFRFLLEPNLASRFGVFAARLRLLDTTTVYPLILFLADHYDNFLDEEFSLILDDLESYFIRRAVCDLTPKNYNRIFLNLLKALKSVEKPSRAVLQREMLAMQGDSTVWPDDELFNRHWLQEPIYRKLGPAKTRVILEALELAYQTSRQERIQIDDTLTIEHIMPQNGHAKDWPQPPNQVDGKPDLEAIYRRVTLRESIGNLSLLVKPLNSSISDSSFAVKRSQIALESRLRLNTYFQQLSDDHVWNEDAILSRSAQLFEIAKSIWPHPSHKVGN